MKQITNKEKETILKFSKNYIHIHNEIVRVEKEIKILESRSSDLINELESCRAEESEFMEKMSKKYGPGKIDPINLKWDKKITSENELLK